MYFRVYARSMKYSNSKLRTQINSESAFEKTVLDCCRRKVIKFLQIDHLSSKQLIKKLRRLRDIA